VSNKAVSTLQLYGKMSLTNYITQSVVGAVIYFPFVFYLAPYCGYAASYLIEFISLWESNMVVQMVADKT